MFLLMVVQVFAHVVRIDVTDLEVEWIVAVVVGQEISNCVRRCRIVVCGTPCANILLPIIEGLKTLADISARHMPLTAVECLITTCVQQLPKVRDFWVQISTVKRNPRFGGV